MFNHMRHWKSVRIACAAGTFALFVAGSVMASGVRHQNYLTFNRAVALPGVVLPAGRYSFDLEESVVEIVVVQNAARTRVLYRGFTNTVGRPNAMSMNTLVAMGEATRNQPAPIATWYEIGKKTGHSFRY